MLESSKNNLVEGLARATPLPKMVRVRQKFDRSHIEPGLIEHVAMEELEKSGIRKKICPGNRIGIACGSRGISNIDKIVRTIVDFVKSCGGAPFIIPAMGSHGGATAEGQCQLLKGYGISEETMGCPVGATMETVYLGDTKKDGRCMWTGMPGKRMG